MGATSIQWTDHSINPLRARLTRPIGNPGSGVTTTATGHYCEKVSPGCKNCYSSRLQPRFQMPVFQEQRRLDIEKFLDASKLLQVLRRKTPTKWFWCDMTDIFGEWVPNETIAACFGVMAATPWHTHQVLTKRPERAREWFEWVRLSSANLENLVGEKCPETSSKEASLCVMSAGSKVMIPPTLYLGACETSPWPLQNVWLGISAEDQQRADERIPVLLETPAAVRFISAEPLLGPLNLRPFLHDSTCTEEPCVCSEPREAHLDWVIVGGESGPGSRMFDLAWARSLIEQCRSAGVPCFLKQLGANQTEDVALPGGGVGRGPLRLKDRKGGDMAEWPESLRVREFPEVPHA